MASSFSFGTDQNVSKRGWSSGIGIGSLVPDTVQRFPQDWDGVLYAIGQPTSQAFSADASQAGRYNANFRYLKAAADVADGGAQSGFYNRTGFTVKAGQYFWGLTPTTASYLMNPGPPGTTTQGIDTPDTAAIGAAMSQPIDLRYRLAPTVWNNASADGFGGQVAPSFSPATETCFYITRTQNTRQITLTLNKAVGGLAPCVKTYPAFTDGSFKWLRWTYDPTAAPPIFTAYWGDDGVNWNSLGTLTTAAPGAIQDSSQVVSVGMQTSTGFLATPGKISRFELRSPINGPIICGFDASLATGGQTTRPGLAGETWTIRGAAYFV